MSSGLNSAQDTSPGGHLGPVQVLSLSLAPLSDLLVLGLDIGEDAIKVQVWVVVRGEDHMSFLDGLLQLGQILCSRAWVSPWERALTFWSSQCYLTTSHVEAQGHLREASPSSLVFQASQGSQGA